MPANLCNVSTRATKKPRQSIDPRPGRRIAARRTFLGKTLDDIEEETAGVVYRNLLSRIENGHKAADTMRANQVNALLPALQWTHADWIEALDLSPQNEADTQGTAVVQPHITPHGSREIPVIDMLSAGLGGEGGTIVDHVAIPDAPPEPRQPQARDLEDWRAQVRKALKGSQRDVILAADAWAVLSPEGVLDVTFGVSE